MTISESIVKIAGEGAELRPVTPAQYIKMKYPRLLPLMRFNVSQYEVKGYGNLMTMDTNAMFGLMRLSTIVFTPSEGAALPFLLIDTMDMKNKHLAYVEYYDCTGGETVIPGSDKYVEKYREIPDYAEKEAWYIARRTPYSLIKGGENVSADALSSMVITCARDYLNAMKTAPKDPKNLVGLKSFQQDMMTLGNPSSDTLTKVLGDEGARGFFEKVIMPVG